MNDLASALSHQGKYEQVEEMHRQVLGRSETMVGKELSDRLTSMNNLTLVLSDQGKYDWPRSYEGCVKGSPIRARN